MERTGLDQALKQIGNLFCSLYLLSCTERIGGPNWRRTWNNINSMILEAEHLVMISLVFHMQTTEVHPGALLWPLWDMIVPNRVGRSGSR